MEEFLIRDLQKNVFTHTDTSQEEMELVKEYLAENTAYQSNAETGVFAGKSVILIQAESLTTMTALGLRFSTSSCDAISNRFGTATALEI